MFNPAEHKLVTPAKRYQGQFIDGLVSTVLFIVSLILTKQLLSEGGSADFAIIFLPVTYYLISDALPNGQSIGKKLLGISVVSKSTGRKCSILQSIVRNIIAPFLGIIDAFLVLSKRRQRLGDLFANTVVIYGKPEN